MIEDESTSEDSDGEKNYIKKMRHAFEETLIEDKKTWESRCLHEIPYDCLSNIIKMTYPTIVLEDYDDILNESMWKECYQSYRRWKSCVYQNLSEEVILEIPEITEKSVSCLATCKKYIAIGTTMGEIIIYDLSNPNVAPIEFQYEGKIIQMVFWKPNLNKLLLVSLSSSSEVKFWDIRKQQEFEKKILVNASNICTGTMQNLFIESDGLVECYEFGMMDHENHLANRKKIKVVLQNKEKIARMFSEKHEMLLISIYTIHVRTFHINVPTHSSPFFKIIRTSPYIELFENTINIDSYHFHMPAMNLTIGSFTHNNFTDNSLGFLTTKNDSWYLNNSTFGKNIQSVAMHANLLILGSKTGKIKIIPVDDERVFVSHIEMYWSHEIKLEDNPITGLNYTEFNKKTYIIVASKKRVYMIYPSRRKQNSIGESQSQSQ
ncbi:uncharacterized protein [Chelonus insularis]|uniref:uncharacterized protein n=1 Tax=Chelonus insularis TaxID=460826 RepID=UPI00158A92CE|nr:uncharacterized protein LOC118067722 [Chelonus insularis]